MISKLTDIRGALRSRQRGIILNPYRFGASGIPDSAITALLHFNGTNGSTTFTDESLSYPKTWTAAGTVSLTTGGSLGPKFGTASLSCGGGHISASASAAFGFGTGDYTVEGWHGGFVSGTTRCIFDNRSASDQGIAIYVTVGGDQKLTVFNNTSPIIDAGNLVGTVTWEHWAVCRKAGIVKAYIRGLSIGSASDTRTYASAPSCTIGSNYLGTQPIDGQVDEVRVTNGYARYDANFTPPAAAFANPV